MAFTKFDKEIQNLLEDIFAEIQKVYLKRNGIPYHFLGSFGFINIKDYNEITELSIQKGKLEKLAFIKKSFIKLLNKNSDYLHLKKLIGNKKKERYSKENIEILAKFSESFNSTITTLLNTFVETKNKKIFPIHEKRSITDINLDDIAKFCYLTEQSFEKNNLIHTSPALQEINAESLIENFSENWKSTTKQIDYLYTIYIEGDKIEPIENLIFDYLNKSEFYKEFQKYLPNNEMIFKEVLREKLEYPDEKFDDGINFMKSTGQREDLYEENTQDWFEQHYPFQFNQSSLYYEFFEEEIIVSNYTHIIFSAQTEIDADIKNRMFEKDWIPKGFWNYYFEVKYPIQSKIIFFLIEKIFFFEENINFLIKRIKKFHKFKKKKLTIKFIIKDFQATINDPKRKLKIIEGVKFTKLINDNYLKCLISLLNKRLLINDENIIEYIIPSENHFSDFDYIISERLTTKLSQLEVINKNNIKDFYYPYKLFWNEKEFGDIKQVFYELSNPKYIYKGNLYMNKDNIDILIERNFSLIDKNQLVECNQIGLSYNKHIGVIREFLGDVRLNFFKEESGERFSQILRDNFYNHYKKYNDLSYKSLSKIATNLDKGNKIIKIVLP